jgi:hypothetical protein
VNDVDVMPRLRLAEAEPDATDISVRNYEPMIGGYSRVMAQSTRACDAKARRSGASSSFVLIRHRSAAQTDRRTEWDASPSAGAAGASAVLVLRRAPPVRRRSSGIPSTTPLSYLNGGADIGAGAV